MQSKQEFARVAAGRLGRKTGRGTYEYERGAIRLPSPHHRFRRPEERGFQYLIAPISRGR